MNRFDVKDHHLAGRRLIVVENEWTAWAYRVVDSVGSLPWLSHRRLIAPLSRPVVSVHQVLRLIHGLLDLLRDEVLDVLTIT